MLKNNDLVFVQKIMMTLYNKFKFIVKKNVTEFHFFLI